MAPVKSFYGPAALCWNNILPQHDSSPTSHGAATRPHFVRHGVGWLFSRVWLAEVLAYKRIGSDYRAGRLGLLSVHDDLGGGIFVRLGRLGIRASADWISLIGPCFHRTFDQRRFIGLGSSTF